MQDATLAAYEAAPYESHPITAAYVPWVETVALLHGLPAPPSDHCRVLELGCASGGHLIPMAYQLRESHFVGIDLAPSQVAQGHRAIEALGLTNVELHAKSITDVGDDFGVFDYILCHGVYSWVPPDVQDAVLRVCSRNLAPNGVAYVSYNTYPGWHLRGMVRDMLRFHDDPSLSPAERVARGRAFVNNLALPDASRTIHQTMLEHEAKMLGTLIDSQFLHEQLEPFNRPIYFTDFARHASAHGLRYLGDSTMRVSRGQIPEWLQESAQLDDADVIRRQQYVDFVQGRTFRRSLLCHDHLSTRAMPAVDAIPSFKFSTLVVPMEPTAEDAAKGIELFRAPDGSEVGTADPTARAVLWTLRDVSPLSLTFDELVARVRHHMNGDGQDDLAAKVAEVLLVTGASGIVNPLRHVPAFAATISERPVASAVARLAALQGAAVPTLSHRTAVLSDLDRFVLLHLDGTRSRADLLDLVTNAVHGGVLSTTKGEPLDVAQLSERLDFILGHFVTAALLEA